MKKVKNRKVFSAVLAVSMLTSSVGFLSACRGPATLTEVQMMMPATKTEYIVGESFDPTGLMLVGVYSDGTRASLTNYTIDKTGKLEAEDTSVTITCEGWTFEIPISVITADQKIVITLANGVDQCWLYANGNVELGGGVPGGMTPETAHWTWDGETLEIWLTLSFGFNSFDDHQTKMELEYDEQQNLQFKYMLRGMWQMNYFCSYNDWSEVLTPNATFPIGG